MQVEMNREGGEKNKSLLKDTIKKRKEHSIVNIVFQKLPVYPLPVKH